VETTGGGRKQGARAVDVVAAVAMLAVVAVTFAPWLRSGEVRRDSYELVRTADHLGIFEGATATAVRVGWAFLPLVAALGLFALARGRRRVGHLAAVTVGGIVLVVGFGLQAAGEQADWGAKAAMVIGGVSAVSGTFGLISGRRRRDET